MDLRRFVSTTCACLAATAAVALPMFHLAKAQTVAASQNLDVVGDIPAAMHLAPADLDALPQETVEVPDQDETTSKYTGVSLRAVLEKAGAPTGKSLRGKSMASYVLAKARDGYEVVFSLAELDPGFGNEKVVIAYKHDGKPLFQYQGPYRIVCPDDKAGARSIRMLEALEVVKLRK